MWNNRIADLCLGLSMPAAQLSLCQSGLSRLFYRSTGSDSLQALPDWAHNFVSLGEESAEQKGEPLRLFLASPARNYLSVLIAAGYITRLIEIVGEDETRSKIDEVAAGLEKGFLISYATANGRFKGVFEDWVVHEKRKYIRVAVQGRTKKAGELSNMVPYSELCDLEICQKGTNEVPRRTGQHEAVNPFLLTLLNSKVAKTLQTQAKLDCLIVGQLNRLRADIETPVICRTPVGKLEERSLLEIVRIKRFLKQGDAYRSDILLLDDDWERSESPRLVIFDGVSAFLKKRDYFWDSHWVVILEKTHNQLEEAVQVANQNYYSRSEDFSLRSDLSELNGFEVMSFVR